MRVPLFIAALASACGAGETQSTPAEGPAGTSPSPPGATGDAAEATPDSTSTQNQTEQSEGHTPAFSVRQPLGAGAVGGQVGNVEIPPYVSLLGGGSDAMFGVAGGVLDGDLATQVFRWSPGGEAELLDEPTPWKNLRFADPNGLWAVGERGRGGGDAQAFVWTHGAGLTELLIDGSHTVTARGVSRDGSVVVGEAYDGTQWAGYRWTADGGVQSVPLPPGYVSANTLSVSADGSTIFGALAHETGHGECFRWVAPGLAEPLGLPATLDGRERSACSVRNVAADGGAAAGGAIYHTAGEEADRVTPAFHWSETDGLRWLDLPDGFQEVAAVEISGDGRAVYGQLRRGYNEAGEQPFRWTAESGTVPLGLADGVHSAELLALGVRPRADLSDDGSTVVGNSLRQDAHAFRWSTRDGLVALQPLSGHGETKVTHLGRSGRFAAGLSIGSDAVEAVLWDHAGNAHAVRTLLSEAGVDIGEFSFDTDVAVFDDGKRVLGSGTTAQGLPVGWVALLPAQPQGSQQ